ncbi:hypothetical protein [Paenibacillus oceani]|uniref:Glycosyl hydrolase-like 10 domain-containing protein n=1 Tax=Paenibacillus oceani TaxID=2772510 RepID=A0A927C9R5_9BACL|nr:hypothetical protein [Paenibacillus oceani]MBD2862722.1 hypothetical protein [Paenibacillus oceani]
MIRSIVQRNDNLVELKLGGVEGLISCEMRISVDGLNWKAASLYPGLDTETVLNGNGYLWSQAVSKGIVRLSGQAEPRFYWNSYLNLGTYCGAVSVRLIVVAIDGIHEYSESVELSDRGVVYCRDWVYPAEGTDVSAADGGEGRSFGVLRNEFSPYATMTLPASGEYDIYFGLPAGGLRQLVRVDAEPFSRIVTSGNSMDLLESSFNGKANKEIYWKRHKLDGSVLELAKLKETLVEHHQAGKIGYVKLVPAAESRNADVSSVRKPVPELILYYEPYSYSLHGFHDGATMNGVMLEEFLRLKPREITCQTVRIGMKSLHHSHFLQRLDTPARTDENTIIDDPVKLANNCDILSETVVYAKGRGVRLTANVGMNRPYLWLPAVSERFSQSNPGLLSGGEFDYGKEEVREYALRILFELVDNYDIDGLFLDYMRSFGNQTAESIVYILRQTKERLNRKSADTGRPLELKVRIPADQAHYFRAMQISVEHGYVDGIVPSNSATSEPFPPVEHFVAMCKGTAAKVYGCIDGWKRSVASDPRAGSLCMAHSPQDLLRYIDHYTNLGVDGIFIYQADQFTANPFLNKVFAPVE